MTIMGDNSNSNNNTNNGKNKYKKNNNRNNNKNRNNNDDEDDDDNDDDDNDNAVVLDSTIAARLREKIRLQALDLLDKADTYEQRQRVSVVSVSGGGAGGEGSSSLSVASSLSTSLSRLESNNNTNNGTAPTTPAQSLRQSMRLSTSSTTASLTSSLQQQSQQHQQIIVTDSRQTRNDNDNDNNNSDHRSSIDMNGTSHSYSNSNSNSNSTTMMQQNQNQNQQQQSITSPGSNNSTTVTTTTNSIELTKRIQKLALTQISDRLQHHTQRLRVLQSDTTSHLSSIKTFQELNLPNHILDAIFAMGFNRPSAIQAEALPRILANPPRNIIGQAQSGSGKTAAFTIGMLARIVVDDPPTCQALCVTPTRELAIQIVDTAIRPMSMYMKGIQVQLAVSQSTVGCSNNNSGSGIVNGTDPQQNQQNQQHKQQQQHNNNNNTKTKTKSTVQAHIVVGTPGKIVDWLKRKIINPKTMKVFVLDEADHMVENDGGHRANSILIKKHMPHNVQCLLFSATFPKDNNSVLQFVTKMIGTSTTTNSNSSTTPTPPCDKILLEEGKPEGLVLDAIKQLWVDTRTYTGGSKLEFLAEIYSLLTIGQSIVFVGTKDEADLVHQTLTASGYTCSVLHSRVDVSERDSTMEQFRNGKSNVLITTNVLARGVDVDNVCFVVNYDVPLDRDRQPAYETYLHRIGRTGRFGRKGTAITFVDSDQSLEVLKNIEKYFMGIDDDDDDVTDTNDDDDNNNNTNMVGDDDARTNMNTNMTNDLKQRNKKKKKQMIFQVQADPEALADMIEI